MAPSQHQEEFLSYVQANPQVQPLAVFPAQGKTGRDLPVVFAGLHVGMLALFPEYLAFLTREADNPGLGLAAKQFAKAYAGAWIDTGKEALGLAGLIYEATRGKQKEETRQNKELREAMGNPQSLFIPLQLLRTVETGRILGATHYLRIGTTERTYVFISQPEQNVFRLMGQIANEWQPKAVAYLRQAAARNTAPATAASRQAAASNAPPRPTSASLPLGSTHASASTSTRPGAAPSASDVGTPLGPAVGAARGPVPHAAPRANAPLRAPAPATTQAATAATAAQPRRRSGGCGALILLLLVGLVVGGIAVSHHNGNAGGTGGGSSIPDVSGSYTGTAHNNAGTDAPMTLTLDQQGTSLSGTLAVSSPLGGSGPLQGQVDESGDVTFEVTSADGTGVTIDFSGSLTASGNELAGRYSVDNGQSGTWDVVR